MSKNLHGAIRGFSLLYRVTVDFKLFGHCYRMDEWGRMVERIHHPANQTITQSFDSAEDFLAAIKGCQTIRILQRGQEPFDVHPISWGEFLLLIEATSAFKSREEQRVAKEKFFARPWIRGRTPEEWLGSMTRKSEVVHTVTGQTVVVTPRIADSLTQKQYEFMLDCIGRIEIDEPHPGLGADYIVREFNAGKRTFGRSACVETTSGDDVFYAHLGGQNWGRFVCGRKPEPCSWLTIILRRQGDSYNVHRAYIGRIGEPFPGDPNERGDASRRFWATHALVNGTIQYRQDSVTVEPPRWFVHGGRQAELIAAGHVLPDAVINRA